MNNSNVKPHWSFWLICAVALVWNGMGCMNFITQMNTEMLVKFPEAARALIEARPGWATAAFALAVFGGLVGDVLLILRKYIAIYLFVLYLLAWCNRNKYTYHSSQ